MKKIEFDEVAKKSVKMTPMNLLFPSEIIEELLTLNVRKGWCYENAVKVARFLEEKGYEVDVVEGYYRSSKKALRRFPEYLSEETNCWLEHRWCKFGDYYFDPTFYLDRYTFLTSQYFEYRAERLYYADDLLNFAEQVGKDYISAVPFYCTRNTIWCSSLTGATSLDDGRTTVHLAKVDEDFNYVKVAS
jgi:hypothetical protein